MRNTDSEKKTYERPTLEKKQRLVEIAEGVIVATSPAGRA